jgi:hypothetical protein
MGDALWKRLEACHDVMRCDGYGFLAAGQEGWRCSGYECGCMRGIERAPNACETIARARDAANWQQHTENRGRCRPRPERVPLPWMRRSRPGRPLWA